MDVARDLDDAELLDSLDWNRSVVVRKLDGLTNEQATAVVTPTGVTLLGVVIDYLAAIDRSREIVQQASSLDVRSVIPRTTSGS